MVKRRAITIYMYLAIVVLILFLFSLVLYSPLGFKTIVENTQPELREYVVPSKYENVQTKTVERRLEDRRYLLHASWPVTENELINIDLDAIASDFISEFEESSSAIRNMREEYIEETGSDGATFHANYNMNFDVSFANSDYLAFTFNAYRNTGNTGTEEVFTIIYNRNNGERIPLSDLFSTGDYLEKLSDLAREDLYKRIEEEAQSTDFDSRTQRDEWVESFKINMVDPGTEPTENNFRSIVINSEGFLEINFDKYQVAPGSWGVVTIRIPLIKIEDLFSEEVRELFKLNTEVEESTPTRPPEISDDLSSIDCDIEKCIALTFDDGPSVYTDDLISMLKEREARATFFVLGINARIQQQTVLNLAKAGMEIGNHTWDHQDLTKLSVDEIKAQVNQTGDLIETITGARPSLVRPPYGAINEASAIATNNPVILWSIDPEDWRHHDSEYVANHIIENAERNAIVLAHDIHETTVLAIPKVIDELVSQGYRFVTISELFGEVNLLAGNIYR